MISSIVFFPKYSAKGPSSRYRIYSYLPYYERNNINYKIYPLFGDWYLDCIWNHSSRLKILYKILWTYIKRLYNIIILPKNCIVYIGAELFPAIPFVFERILIKRKIPYIIEFDDAVFEKYEKNKFVYLRKVYRKKFQIVIEHASHIICGSQYLKDYCIKWNKEVTIIPTSVDKNKYNVELKHSHTFIIGWIGSPTSSKYLSIVIPALKKLSKERDFILYLIGFDKTQESILKGINYNIIKWDEDSEISHIAEFNVGIMPLTDEPFSRGKCAFKLIQYMAIGIPTISTPLQSNIDIDAGAGNLFASNTQEWIDSIKFYMNNKETALQIGKRNREIAIANYTRDISFQKYLSIINKIYQNCDDKSNS